MNLLAGKKGGSEVLLVFDIGSGSVGGAIALVSSDGPPAILYSTRSEILFTREASSNRLLSLCLRALSEVMLALLHEGFPKSGLSAKHPRVKEALVSLSAPWTASRTSFLHLRNPKPMRITESVFQALLHEAEKSRIEREPKGSVEIEKKLVRSVLNGYETASPYGKEATEAEFTLCSSFSLPKITEKITEMITHLVHPEHLSFHSFSLLSFATLRDIHPQSESFIFMDVSGEQTEVSIVKKSVPLETISFPFGKNHLVRALANAGLPPATAESFMKLHVENKGDGRLYEKATGVFEAFGDEWLKHFLRAVATFSEEMFLPKTLYLTSDDTISPVIQAAIAKGDFSKFTLASAPFEITLVDGAALQQYAHIDPSLTIDPFLTLETLFAARLRTSA